MYKKIIKLSTEDIDAKNVNFKISVLIRSSLLYRIFKAKTFRIITWPMQAHFRLSQNKSKQVVEGRRNY